MSNTTFFCGSSELVQLDRTIGVYWFKKSRTSGAWNRIGCFIVLIRWKRRHHTRSAPHVAVHINQLNQSSEKEYRAELYINLFLF
uniref:Uncharacterized protein n=1 Tax=Aegilops tauschii subsp. strangulata TaxID=200361 RepID=A0A452Z6Q5_AEGTS